MFVSVLIGFYTARSCPKIGWPCAAHPKLGQILDRFCPKIGWPHPKLGHPKLGHPKLGQVLFFPSKNHFLRWRGSVLIRVGRGPDVARRSAQLSWKDLGW